MADQPASRIPATAIDRRESALPVPLTPAQRTTRRRNRRWLLGITVVTFAMLAVGFYIGNRTAGPSGPAPSRVPSGYKAVSDGYFAYAIPSGWSTSDLYSDFAGDLYNGSRAEWAAENLGSRATAPVLGEAQPASLAAFGEDPPQPYSLAAGHPTKVAGAATAFEYTVTRPGGFTATAIDAWDSSSGAEIWLLVHASPAITTEILSTFQA